MTGFNIKPLPGAKEAFGRLSDAEEMHEKFIEKELERICVFIETGDCLGRKLLVGKPEKSK